MEILFTLFLFFIGICIGSFLNVVIDRTGNGESILFGRSHCDHCRHPLFWYDLFPLFSFIFLLGKCRYCHKKLKLQYPAVELLTGVIFFTAGTMYLPYIITASEIIRLVLTLSVLSCFIAIFFIDLKFGIIPDELIIIGSLCSLLLSIFYNGHALFDILTGIGTLCFFLVIFLATRQRGIGFGDVKLGFFMGLFLGFPQIFIAVYAAFVSGAIIGLWLVAQKKKKFFGGVLPFGPFLIFGIFLSFFYGVYLLKIALHSLF